MGILLGGVAVVFLVAILAVRRAVRRRGAGRVYWAACALLILAGSLGIAWVFVFPPERFDEDGQLIGEMPVEFAMALAILELGLLGSAGGVIVDALRRLRPAPRK